jgi:hypothetical protein
MNIVDIYLTYIANTPIYSLDKFVAAIYVVTIKKLH